jgi:hypothetical protein
VLKAALTTPSSGFDPVANQGYKKVGVLFISFVEVKRQSSKATSVHNMLQLRHESPIKKLVLISRDAESHRGLII